MSVFSIIALILLCLVFITHLVFCFIENEKLRRITKVLCIPMLALLVLSFNLDAHNHFIPWQVYAGLLCAWLGDIFLIGREKGWALISGTGCFAVCHIFYIWIVISKVAFFNAHFVSYILLGIIFVITFVGGFLALKKKAGTLSVGSGLYFGLLVSELYLFIVLAIVSKLPISYLGIGGMLLHIASDVFLVYTIFYKPDFKRRHFYIMATYLASQTMITLALIF